MDNRSNILNCALDLFAARGYDAIGVQEMADAAGVTKPTLYHYFGSKRGVLETLASERFAPLLSQLEQATVFNRDLAQTLRNVARTYFAFAQREPALYRMQLAMWFAFPDNEAFQIIAGVTGKQQHLLEAMFQAFAAQHGNMRGRHRLYAAAFLGALNTYIGLFLNGHLALDDAAVQQAVQYFVYGIYS